MTLIKDPFGNTMVFHGSEAEAHALQRKLQARVDFCKQYGAERGWPDDVKLWTIPQIIEVRKDPRWEKAGEQDNDFGHDED